MWDVGSGMSDVECIISDVEGAKYTKLLACDFPQTIFYFLLTLTQYFFFLKSPRFHALINLAHAIGFKRLLGMVCPL